MVETIDERFDRLRRAAKCPMYLRTDDGRVVRIIEWTATTLAEPSRVNVQIIGFMDDAVSTEETEATEG